MAASISMNQAYIDEMNKISKTISSFSGYKAIASALGNFVSQDIVAGLIGCIIPESGTNHRILNAKEYNGRGASGTSGWNCGEGLVQWTFWKYKLPLIQKYNAHAKSTQKLPTDWSTYSKGSPSKQGGFLVANEDGRHIAGLSLTNQMLFLTIYYQDVIKSLASESNLAVIVARIYQYKAGIGFYTEYKNDPVKRAYLTAKYKYPSSGGNHYLQSLKIAKEYLGSPVTPTSEDAAELGDMMHTSASTYTIDAGPNKVMLLSSSKRQNENVLKQSDDRKAEFLALQTSMVNNTPEMGRDIILSEEMYDANILKGGQESKKERT